MRQGTAWIGKGSSVWLDFQLYKARQGGEWLCEARKGPASHGNAWRGKGNSAMIYSVIARRGLARCGQAR